jgi:hypothetical protein
MAEAVIAPPLGLAMAGWTVRAAGFHRAFHVHDDLLVRAFVVGRDAAARAAEESP